MSSRVVLAFLLLCFLLRFLPALPLAFSLLSSFQLFLRKAGVNQLVKLSPDINVNLFRKLGIEDTKTRLLQEPSTSQFSILAERARILTGHAETCWFVDQLHIVFSFID